MPVFGGRSLANLKNVHPDLVRVMTLAIASFDFMIIQSVRTSEEQEADFIKGTTKAHFGQSAHDFNPSYAVDCAPLPLNWSNVTAFSNMLNAIKTSAAHLNIRITWGGDWHSIRDFPHFELTDWKIYSRVRALTTKNS